ncbi:restriction endonuclease [Lichenicoccus roseus]|uniref:restriction endonuclease n=1 Tax=Lichenicoccus roseus TaxID=2683649 RepID=UPI0014871E75|nr:restriction endonuclease [Lichenicoccus roseus]
MEELARAFFARQGFLAIRSVSIQFEDEEVTDVDVWLYGRQGGGVRTRALIDVKDKKSPKAFERIMWARGMQLALGADRAIVTTTDTSSKVTRFAQQQKVALLTGAFLRRWSGGDVLHDRLSLEEFISNIQTYESHKQDGDWIRQIASAKSAVVSLAPYPAFNKAIGSFRFFAERAQTRPQHRELAVRGAFLSAALASMALDAALEKLAFEEAPVRHKLLHAGITFGDAGDNRVKSSIETVLAVISKGVKNGRALARQTSDALDQMFSNVRAEIVADFFAAEKNAALLFPVARELEARSHMRRRSDLMALSIEAKAVVGVFADYIGAKRMALLSDEFVSVEPTGLSPFPDVPSKVVDAGTDKAAAEQDEAAAERAASGS